MEEDLDLLIEEYVMNNDDVEIIEELNDEYNSISLKDLELSLEIEVPSPVTINEESNEKEKEKPRKSRSKKTKTNEVTNNIEKWQYPLDSVKDILIINEGDYQEYRYKHLKAPDGSGTGLFICHMKDSSIIDENNNPIWHTMNGCLSRRYVVVNVEELIKSTLNNVNIVGDAIVKHSPYFYSKQLTTNSLVTAFDDKSLTDVLDIIVETEKYSIENIKSNVSILVSNTYDGSMSIRADFVLNNKFIINNSPVVYHDYFLLSKRSLQIQHLTSSSCSLTNELNNIQNWINEDFELYKSYNVHINDVIDSITSKFLRKPAKKMFISLCENLRTEQKNLFNILVLASITLYNNYDVDSHNRIFSFLNTLTNKI